MADSSQHKLSRVRRPRIQITYDVETEGGTVQKELPFVVGVLGDFVGDQKDEEKVPPLAQRNFVDVTGSNFDQVMEKLGPKLSLNPNDDGVPFPIELEFHSMDDFSPDNLVTIDSSQNGIPELNALLQTRSDVSDLLTLVSRSHQLEEMLQHSLENKDGALEELRNALPAPESTASPASATDGDAKPDASANASDSSDDQ